MAKVSVTIELDEQTAFHLQIAARTAGETSEVFAARIFAEAVEATYWAPAQASIAEYERTGAAYEAGPVLAAFKARIRAKAETKQVVED
jgi:hypothetical protein